jgi:hypothetical protein
MQIDRSNYEIWLIDWIDGNLNDLDVAKLKSFLATNPDLKAEFDELIMFKDAMHLIPKDSFGDKEKLKKTSTDLSESQFEYFCAAYLENDLSDDLKSEFLHSTLQDAEKKKSFELIQKMKLTPPDVSFTQKSKLRRRTAGQKTIQLAIIWLSAAAIVSVVIINRISYHRSFPVKTDVTAIEIESDNPLLKPSVQKSSDKLIHVKNNSANKTRVKNLDLLSQIVSPVVTDLDTSKSVKNDTLALSAENPSIILTRIPVSVRANIEKPFIPGTLIAINSRIQIVEEDDGRPRFGKLLAKTFRQKILKENTAKDSPVKVYEIAEAGVSGLNKLLGWEMALDEKKDENGKLKSVYFSSRILKFNAPIKNSESPR